MKYVVVTGGGLSGIGKGIVTSSIGALLKACGQRVTAIKIDPYINIDAGTFSPYEHGEVFVLNDGCEVDLDLGNYERFLDVQLGNMNNITTGKIYKQVIERESKGEYLGQTVRIVPHITDAIQQWIELAAHTPGNDNQQAEICLIELGGTIGDIESMPFVEALRQLRRKVKPHNFCLVHVNLVPSIGPSQELKTKLTQESVHKLKGLGLSPDLIVCRSTIPMTLQTREKISYYSDLEIDSVISLPDLKSIYAVPAELRKQNIIQVLAGILKIGLCPCSRLNSWERISDYAINAEKQLTIALVGKYTSLQDAYTSVIKAVEHSCFAMKERTRPIIKYISAEQLEENSDKHNQAWQDLKSANGLIVPGGFGHRGVNGKINAIKWARENKLPFLGICLGFQLAAVEYAQTILKVPDACSEEFISEDPNCDPAAPRVVISMLEYDGVNKGGTMRLGLRTTKFVTPTSKLRELYGGSETIQERHRHRFEINPEFIDKFEKGGLKFVGKSLDGTRMEILELDDSTHPYFVAVQYHPEYLSRPFKPSPPFMGLIKAADGRLQK